MDIHEKRRLNLRALQKNFRYQKDLADALDLAPAYVSQLLAEPEAKGSRNIGEKVARKIESQLGLETFFLDHHPRGDEEGKAIEIRVRSPYAKQLIRSITRTSESGDLDDDAILTLIKLVEKLSDGDRSR